MKIRLGELRQIIREAVSNPGATRMSPLRQQMARAISGVNKHGIMDQLGIPVEEDCSIRMAPGEDAFLVKCGHPVDVDTVTLPGGETVPVRQELDQIEGTLPRPPQLPHSISDNDRVRDC